MEHTIKQLHFGAAYYPEHWPEEGWTKDIQLMKAAGFTVVRMGEFAWSSFEPLEGQFHFDWLEQAIERLSENGIVSVLGTPTAAPPAWLTQKYPQTLAVNEAGIRYEHGKRCHYCVNSAEYHAHTRRIVNALGERFGSNPNVIGWQFDNEFGTVCYCSTCQKAFQAYLAEKFRDLETINQHWSTAYWSQTYSEWEQIPLPKAGHNPGLMLAFQQFVTHSYKNYQKLQADVLRPYLPEGVWITHNFMKWFPVYDHYALSEDLDLASWDWYVGSGHNDYTESGAAHDLVRGFKQRNFWVMETQPGHVNWSGINNAVNQGEARTMAWHAVGHGADALLYWQWCPALNGQEQYHGTLIDQSGQPRPFYAEAAQIGAEFAKVSDLLAGSEIQSRVAILYDYNSRWSQDWQRHHQDYDYVQHLLHYYKAIARQNIPVDILSADQPLDKKYRLIITPGLAILTPERTQQLMDFVKQGGILILTARTGVKDEFNALLPSRPPGALAEVAGVEVEDYYALDKRIPVEGQLFTGYAQIWAERLRILDEKNFVQPIVRYGVSNGWLDNRPAATVNVVGRGFVYYIGTLFDENAQNKLIEYICKMQRISPLMKTPKGVEVCQRVTPEGQKIYIMINHQDKKQKIEIPWPAREHLSSFSGKGELTLEPYGVVILTKAEEA
jgi:beta-galactosidase